MSDHPSELGLRRLFDENAKYIWRALRHLGVADSDVEDVCQDVWVTVHRKLPEFEGRSALRTWLYGICMRVASDYRRSAYVRRERPTSSPPAASSPADSSAASDVETRQTLLALLGLLDDEKRAVLVLYELEGFTMREVAEIVQTPLQTAYSRLYTARELLAQAVRGNAEE